MYVVSEDVIRLLLFQLPEMYACTCVLYVSDVNFFNLILGWGRWRAKRHRLGPPTGVVIAGPIERLPVLSAGNFMTLQER